MEGEGPPPASERMERRVLQVCNAAGTLVEYWGFKSVMGRVWTLLAITTEPLAQSRIAETLGISRSLVSTTISELSGYGLVRPVAEHRNAPYEAVLDVWPAITDVLRGREWMLLESSRLSLDAAQDEARQGGAGSYSLERLELMQDMVGAVQRLLGLLISIQRPTALSDVAEWVKSMTDLIRVMRRVGREGRDA